jgi:hypothetical protein
MPQRGSYTRQAVDDSLASLLLVCMVVVSLLCWGPIPVASLWIGSQASYQGGSIGLGIVTEFTALFVLLFGALMLLIRLDGAWILVRRAANHDQRSGALDRIFAVMAVVATTGFTVWFFVLHGPGSNTVELML